MRYNNCYCDYDSNRLFWSALAEVLIERYWIFRKQKKFLFWDYTEQIDVRLPKDYQSQYEQKKIEFKMKCVELVDQGYNNGYMTEELLERWRNEISSYLINKNVVWE
jgi:hypothetical protein